jgi:methyl-accepting chemotaxis protein
MSIGNIYHNASVMKKSMIPPAVMTVMLTILLIVITTNLKTVSNNIDDVVYNLAPDTDLAAQIMNKVNEKRLQVKNYIKTSDNSNVEKFKSIADELQQLITTAQKDIKASDRVKLINEIDELNNRYDDAFHNDVVANMSIRNNIVYDNLNKNGKLAEKSLDGILNSAHDNYDIEATFYAGETLKSLLLSRLYVFKYLDTNSIDDNNLAQKELESTQQWLEELLANTTDNQSLQSAREAATQIEAYKNGFIELVAAITKRNNAINNVLDKNGPIISGKTQALKDSVFKSMIDEGEKAKTNIIKTERFSYIVYVIAAIAGIFISFKLAQGIVKPIEKMKGVMDKVADGNLTLRIDINNKDELGQFAANFNQFVAQLEQLIKQIALATEQLSTAAEETSSVTRDSTQNILKQQNETSLVATAINEMTATVREVATNTEQASLAASNGDREVRAGQLVIKQMVESIGRLVTEIEDSSGVIQTLKTGSVNIETVLDVIKSIAEQTNLLALNAAIEAARAGEQGRGFAVVADEVRSLAQKTQESTLEIEQLIATLQSNADDAVSSMDSNKLSVSALAEKTSQATESLNSITSVVSSITEMNAQIATAAEEQSYVVEEVNNNVHNIQIISESNATASQQISSANNEIADLSAKLKIQVMRFQVS